MHYWDVLLWLCLNSVRTARGYTKKEDNGRLQIPSKVVVMVATLTTTQAQITSPHHSSVRSRTALLLRWIVGNLTAATNIVKYMSIVSGGIGIMLQNITETELTAIGEATRSMETSAQL